MIENEYRISSGESFWSADNTDGDDGIRSFGAFVENQGLRLYASYKRSIDPHFYDLDRPLTNRSAEAKPTAAATAAMKNDNDNDDDDYDDNYENNAHLNSPSTPSLSVLLKAPRLRHQLSLRMQ
jgi:hypothetical protein